MAPKAIFQQNSAGYVDTQKVCGAHKIIPGLRCREMRWVLKSLVTSSRACVENKSMTSKKVIIHEYTNAQENKRYTPVVERHPCGRRCCGGLGGRQWGCTRGGVHSRRS